MPDDTPLVNDLVRRIAPPATADERIAITQQVIDVADSLKDWEAYGLALILCTARVCERDVAAQRAELRALVRLAEVHDLGDGLHRLPGVERPTGDAEQDRCLAVLLDRRGQPPDSN